MACGLNVNFLRLTRWPHVVVKSLEEETTNLPVHHFTCTLGKHHRAVRLYACEKNISHVKNAIGKMDLQSWHIVACDCCKEKLDSVIKRLPKKHRVELHDAMPGLLAAAYGRAMVSRVGSSQSPSSVGNCSNPWQWPCQAVTGNCEQQLKPSVRGRG